MVIEGLSKPGDRWRIKSLRIWVTRSPPVPMEHFNRLLRKLLPEKSDFPSGKLSKCQIFGHIADIIDKHYRGLTDQQVANAVETGEWPDLRPAKNENQIQEEDDGHTAPPLPPTVPPNVPPTVPPAIPAAVPPTVPTTITADVTTININSARTYLNITGPFQFSEVEGQSTSREKSSGDKLSDSKEAPQDPKDPAGGEGPTITRETELPLAESWLNDPAQAWEHILTQGVTGLHNYNLFSTGSGTGIIATEEKRSLIVTVKVKDTSDGGT